MKRVLTIFSLLMTFSLCNSQSLTDSLLVFYDMNGNSLDQSGNGYNGTINGATLVPDRLGNPNSAYYFDGIDDYLEFPNVSQLKPVFPVSFSFWVKTSNTATEDNEFFITDFLEGDYHGVWMNVSAYGQLHPVINYGGGVGGTSGNNRRSMISGGQITLGTWHHLVGVIRGATDMDIYVDCVNYGGTYNGTGPSQVAYSTVAGCLARAGNATGGGPAYYFGGYLDEFAYWNRALTATDVQEICNGGLIGVKDISKDEFDVNLYPNPFSTSTTLELNGKPSDTYDFTIFNSLGQEMYIQTGLKNGSYEINRDDLPSGIYFYRLTNSKGSTLEDKIIIQ